MRKLIIDTDIGCDCDDAGALAVAHALEKQGACELLAMTHCTSRVDGCSAIEIINRCLGRDDIPIGKLRKEGFLERDGYAAYLAMHFPSHFRNRDDCPDAVHVLRRALAGLSKEDDVVLVGIGPLVNLSDFLASPPDAISPLSGAELLAATHCRLVVMACCFDRQYYPMIDDNAEWNVSQDIDAARHVYLNWPTEIFTVPFETGVHIQTGTLLKNLPADDPVRISYEQFLKGGASTRSSWDQCAVGFAAMPDADLWTMSEPGQIMIEPTGESIFRPGAGGNHRIVGVCSIQKAEDMIEQWMASRSKTAKETVMA